MRYYFMVNSWNWEMISCRGKYRLANAASRSPNAQTSLKLSIKRVYQLANQPNQRKKERKKGKQRAHRPLLLGSVPSCAYAPADPTQALLFDVSQRRAAPAGGDSYYGARRTPDSSFSARSSLPSSSLRLSQPSHGRPLSFLSSSIVTPMISVHALSGLVNAHCNAVLQVTHAHAAKLFT